MTKGSVSMRREEVRQLRGGKKGPNLRSRMKGINPKTTKRKKKREKKKKKSTPTDS